MGFTVDVDIGGTLTDGLFSDGGRAEVVKVDTTPHDFTVCFFDCLREGSRRFGYDDLEAFLREVEVTRWSSTIATNVVAERKGPRVGLLLSPGAAKTLYGSDPSPAIGFLVQPDHLAEVDPLTEDEVLSAVRGLLERGVRRICISLAGAFEDPSAEQQARRWIESRFPDHYLGSVPVLLGSDMVSTADDRTRTHLALINAYVHTPLASALFKAEDEMLSAKYRRPLYIGHVNGGVARIAKTKGVDTTESGPVFGLAASAWFANTYGIDQALSLDVGGTTTKLGVIQEGRPLVNEKGDLFGIPLDIPWVALRSAAVGGGSVVSLADGKVRLGPESMGAYPGPAAYGFGSDRATLVDALLVAGMMNPDRFLGGRRRLRTELAEAALGAAVAGPLGVDIDRAAQLVLDTATDTIGSVVRDLVGAQAGQAQLFAFGGNGANLAAAVAQAIGTERAVVFRLGPVFSAFGSSVSQVKHVAEAWPSGAEAADPEALNALIDRLRGRVLLDVAGEGFDPKDVTVEVELMVDGKRTSVGQSPTDIARALSIEGDDRSGGGVAVTARPVEQVTVTATAPVARYEPPRVDGKTHVPSASVTRAVLFAGGREEAGIYDWDRLEAGARIKGPAVLEGAANTCTVPPAWELEVDGYGNGVLRRTR